MDVDMDMATAKVMNLDIAMAMASYLGCGNLAFRLAVVQGGLAPQSQGPPNGRNWPLHHYVCNALGGATITCS